MSETRLQIRLIEPELARLFQRIRPQSARAEFADDLAVLALVEILELEQLLGDDVDARNWLPHKRDWFRVVKHQPGGLP